MATRTKAAQAKKTKLPVVQQPERKIEVGQYSVVRGSHFTAKDAAIAGPFIEALMKEYGVNSQDLIPTERVVEAARPEDSPIHPYFEWNKDAAAFQHNLWQARHLINSIRVEITFRTDNSSFRVLGPGFVSIRTSPKTRMYMPISSAMEDPVALQSIMKDALNLLLHWKSRYELYRQAEDFKPFGIVFEAIESIEQDLAA